MITYNIFAKYWKLFTSYDLVLDMAITCSRLPAAGREGRRGRGKRRWKMNLAQKVTTRKRRKRKRRRNSDDRARSAWETWKGATTSPSCWLLQTPSPIQTMTGNRNCNTNSNHCLTLSLSVWCILHTWSLCTGLIILIMGTFDSNERCFCRTQFRSMATLDTCQ